MAGCKPMPRRADRQETGHCSKEQEPSPNSRTRDSLACDLMEPVRPQVDAYLLDWCRREAFRREWFFEQRNGNCRLMGSFADRLAETAPTWSRALAPLAEWIARVLWKSTSRPSRRRAPATRLTQLSPSPSKGQYCYREYQTTAPSTQHLPGLRSLHQTRQKLLQVVWCLVL